MFKKKKEKTIQNFDEEAYLDINQDIKNAISSSQFKDAQHHLRLYGFNEIKEGSRRFHRDFKIFNEEAYVALFVDVAEEIKQGIFSSGYSHFCAKGYTEILSGARVWEKEGAKKKESKERIKHSISGLNLEDFLTLNDDIKTEECSIDLEHDVIVLPPKALEEIESGNRLFHPDYLPFDETFYQKIYPDIRRMIRDSSSQFNTGFEHFCEHGCKEILEGKRKWRVSERQNKVSTYEKIPLEYHWIEQENLHKDSFYTYLFCVNINQEKFLRLNTDVKNAIENKSFDSLDDFLFFNGLDEIERGARFPYGKSSLYEMLLGSIDYAYSLDGDKIFLSGWLFAGKERKIKSIYLSNGLQGVELSSKLTYFERPDLQSVFGDAHKTAGFSLFIESSMIEGETLSEYGLIVLTDDGLTRRFDVSLQVAENTREVSKIILDTLQIESNLKENLDNSVGLALSGYIYAHPFHIKSESIKRERFGTFIPLPKVSVIVPLYGRIDFLEYQLSLFANDAFFAHAVDLIYVLDDPRLTDELNRVLEGLWHIYQIPFSVVTYTENYGFAIANNIGVRYARAPKLLLLNSDVMPLGKGWLGELIDIYDSLEDVGALAPKLLFEDGAVQHAGMVFEKSEVFKMWLNEHPGKGLPDFSDEKEPRVVPAVTAACLLVDAFLYEKVGGLSENYLIGDFEDSDLCLKLTQEKKKNYYVPSVSLCHLERQSQNLFSDTSWRTKVTLFNAWQHDTKWNALITELMENQDAK